MSSLSRQFDNAESVEEAQRRRFKRKRESGYSGAGFWYANYPYMIGAMGAGTDQRVPDDNKHEASDNGQTAAVTDAVGGTTFNGVS